MDRVHTIRPPGVDEHDLFLRQIHQRGGVRPKTQPCRHCRDALLDVEIRVPLRPGLAPVARNEEVISQRDLHLEPAKGCW